MSWSACILIIAVGLLSYVSMANVRDILLEAKETYYRDYRFADVFAGVDGYPAGKIDVLARIPGIRDVDARMVRDVRVLMPAGRTMSICAWSPWIFRRRTGSTTSGSWKAA